MAMQKYNVVGVMSGTSLDGVDLANITFYYNNGTWDFEIHEAATIAYSSQWVHRLKAAVSFNAEELVTLNSDYTKLLGGIISGFITKNNIQNLYAVCSHGHTILHQPGNGITLQIGNLPEIAQLAGVKTICDFRVQDVQMGGQGAPLVPIGDRLLFNEYDACLNLGGFSNISFEKKGQRVAYDICPVNTVLNFYAAQLGFDYDAGGEIAATGNIHEALLSQLNALEFYGLPFPKSLGFEFVKTVVLPLIEGFDLDAGDKLATFSEHVALQLSYALVNSGIKRLLVTGGGAYNTHFINRLRNLLPDVALEIPDATTIEYKEALIFALLGVLRMRNETNVLSSVTGASQDHCAGYIYLP